LTGPGQVSRLARLLGNGNVFGKTPKGGREGGPEADH